MKTNVFVVVFLLMLSAQSHADTTGASSIEWLSCESEVIVVGNIKENTIINKRIHVTYEDCTVKIIEVIKGDIKGKDMVFCLLSRSGEQTAKDFMNSEDGVLLFLSKSENHGMKQYIDKNKYVLTSIHSPRSILDLSVIPKDVYSKEMRILTDKKEILNIVRTWANSKITYSVSVEVPDDSPIYMRLFNGSECYLTVPAEEKYRAQFLKTARSGTPYEREKAAWELYKFPGEETEIVLRELLRDESGNFSLFPDDTISRVEFGVRAAACGSLKLLGKPVPNIEVSREPTKEEQQEYRSLRNRYWQKSFNEALSGGWKVISVENGNTRQVEGHDKISIIVTCGDGVSRCRFVLIPKEWNENDFPAGANLGINGGRHNQDGRYFFLDGFLPKKVQEKLIKYFGLERF